jgi:hypothetical protein
VCATGALAQNVIAPPPAAYQNPSVLQPATTGPGEGIPPALGFVVSLGPRLILDFHPSLLYRLIYDDGTPYAPGQRISTTIQEIDAGLRLDLGSHWNLACGTSVSLYSSSQFSDSTAQFISLAGHTTYQDWAFGLSGGYSTSDSILQETETQTEQQTYSSGISASRQLSSHLVAQFGMNQSYSTSSENGSSQDVAAWSVSAGLNYQVWSRFTVGITASGGVDLISPGANMTFEQGQATVNYRPGDKFSLSLSAGLEDTQLMGAQLVNPVFSASAAYKPWAQTTVSLTASRTVNPSYFYDQVTVDTGFNLSLSQRLLQRLTLTASAGYSSTPYIGFALVSDANAFNLNGAPLSSVSSVTRQDDSTFVTVRLSCALLKRGSVSIFYSKSDTTSSISDFSLTSTQVGLELGYHY